MSTTQAIEQDLSAGTYVRGIALSPTTFLASTTFSQLRVITRDPAVLQPNSRLGSEDPDIIDERAIHELVQRALAGSKKSNVAGYQKYIEELVTDRRKGVLPPMHLWSEAELDPVSTPNGNAYLLVPNGEHLLAIDGETQLTAHYALSRSGVVDPAVKADHRKWALSAVIHHGIPTTTARQYFYDLNVLAVRPNVSLGLGMNTQDPIMAIVGDVEASSDVLRGRVERQARQLPRKSDKMVTITNLRQMVITIAKGIGGIQYGARPMPMDGIDVDELRAVAIDWIGDYFAAFPVEILTRDNTLAGAGPVLAAVGALGQRLLTTPVEERASARADMIADLRAVDWRKGERWNGIAGGFTATGVFSVKGTKEVAYGVHNALADPHSPGYDQIRGRSTRPAGGSAGGAEEPSVAPSASEVERQLDALPWDDETNA